MIHSTVKLICFYNLVCLPLLPPLTSLRWPTVSLRWNIVKTEPDCVCREMKTGPWGEDEACWGKELWKRKWGYKSFGGCSSVTLVKRLSQFHPPCIVDGPYLAPWYPCGSMKGLPKRNILGNSKKNLVKGFPCPMWSPKPSTF